MAILKLKIDLGGTFEDEAWRHLQQFSEIDSASFGKQYGSSGLCSHGQHLPHLRGEWRGAQIVVGTSLLAQYALSHYLEQDRVIEAEITG